MTELDQLLTRLETLSEALRRGEPVEGVRVAEVARRARELGPSVQPARRQELLTAVTSVLDACSAQLGALDDELRKLGAGRRALRSYGGRRVGGRGQRLSRSA